MRLLLYFIIFQPCIGNGFAQVPALSDKVYEISELETLPSFPGGDRALLKYMSENLNCSTTSMEEMCLSVVVSFIISETGKTREICMEKNISGICEEEVLQLIAAMPDWTPGKVKGKMASARLFIPFKIRFQ